MASIINYVLNEDGDFGGIRSWNQFRKEVDKQCDTKYDKRDKSIAVGSWRKFKRYINKALSNDIFAQRTDKKANETRLRDHITNKLGRNDVFVIDINIPKF